MAAEEDMEMSKIMDELGIAQTDGMADAPRQKKQEEVAAVDTAAADPALSDLEARLNNLKRS